MGWWGLGFVVLWVAPVVGFWVGGGGEKTKKKKRRGEGKGGELLLAFLCVRKSGRSAKLYPNPEKKGWGGGARKTGEEEKGLASRGPKEGGRGGGGGRRGRRGV
ncbi:hypothetical protein ACTHTX_10890 [Neisseria sp. P0018.S002]